jgi:23S rRNA pseudouridine1911/1915/1917 synthase
MTTDNLNTKEIRPLLEWLLRNYPDTPRKRAKEWIQAGRISVNGVVTRRSNELIPDPQNGLLLLDRQATTLDCGPRGLPLHELLTLVYLDSSFAIVNKAPGLLSVPATDTELPCALDILIRALTNFPPTYRKLRPSIVHRIDLFTSGLFCIALNPSARANLIEQVRAHTMQREYIAYAEGRPPKPKGTWRNWLKLSADETQQTVASSTEAGAMESITHYEVIGQYPRAGAVKFYLRLETGRRHQIRIQAAYAGYPLIGEGKYVKRPPQIRFPRQALHATLLSLDHPERPGTRMTFNAPIPEDLSRLEAALRSGRIR